MSLNRIRAFLLWGLTRCAIPVLTALATIWILLDPHRLEVTELRSNTLLMGSRPLFNAYADAHPFLFAVGASAVLLATALIGAALFGISTGVIYAWTTHRLFRTVAWSLSTFAVALPAFFWAIALEFGVLAVFLKFGWRLLPMAGFGIDQHLVLPAIALGIRPAGYLFRLTATSVDEIKHAEYVRTALAKGIGPWHLLLRHVLPNAMPTISGALLLAARTALSSLAIVEFVYVWGGAGLTFVQALGTQRFELAMLLAMAFAIVSVGLSILARLVRPRVAGAQ